MNRGLHIFIRLGLVSVAIAGLWVFMQSIAYAHCDTLDGPVVSSAKAALDKGEITPVLKWVRKEDEKGITDIFNKTMAVRKKGTEAKELADRYFFETVVRIHRAAEGAPYTGLKPVGEIEAAISAADRALETGSVDRLVKLVTGASEKGIRERFASTLEAKKHADSSVEAGRKFVEEYVDFTHYIERLHADAEKPVAHGKSAETGTAHQH
jgi:hypothetical protein